jgi:hypothetical protein
MPVQDIPVRLVLVCQCESAFHCLPGGAFPVRELGRVANGVGERSAFLEPDPDVGWDADRVAAVSMLGRQFPKVEQMLRGAEADATAFAAFPVSRWKKIWSTNPLSVTGQ